jgi:colanic acid/amylovoran biosynthesis protein
MKIVIINAYVRENAGDAALLSVCLRQVREAFPGADVRIAGMEDPRLHAEFEGAPNLGSICRHVADGTASKARRILRRLWAAPVAVTAMLLPGPAGRAVLWLLAPEARREADAVREADLVVSMGGGYLYARPGLDGYQNVFFILLPALLAQRAGVPVVFAPQSYGPFPARAQRRLVRWALRRCALVLAREDVSLQILRDCGLTSDEVHRSVDSAFAFAPERSPDWRDPNWRGRLGVAAQQELVGITARRWLPPQAQERYERALAATIDDLQAQGARVVLIPQVTSDYLDDDDRIVEGRVAGYCTRPPVRVAERADYRELKGLYGECALLIGTRFHSVIFSLTSGVPCVAIEYEHKTRGIMADLGLSDWVLPIEEVTEERLGGLVARLRGASETYRVALRAELPDYIRRADEFPELLRAAVSTDSGPRSGNRRVAVG